MKHDRHYRSTLVRFGLVGTLAVSTLGTPYGCHKTEEAAPAPAASPVKAVTPVAAGEDPDNQPAPDGIPEPDLLNAEPQVAELIRHAREGVVKEPESAEAWGYFGQVCHAHFINKTAERCYAKAHELDPSEFKWAYLLAIVRKQTNADLEGLIADFRTASDLNPKYAPALYHLGETLARAGKQDEAQQVYEQALEVDENLALAHRGLGQILLAKGDLENARKHVELAVNLLPGDGASRNLFAQVLNRIGKKKEAGVMARAATRYPQIEEPPDPILDEVDELSVSAAAATQKGRARMAEGDFWGAIPDLEKVVELLPDDAEARVDLGTAYLNSKRVDDAIEQFRKALELLPDLTPALVKLAWALRVKGDFEESVKVFRQGVEAAPDDFRFHAGIAAVLTEQGDYEAAVAAARRAVELAPDVADVHQILGKALMKQGDRAGAEAEFKETLRIAPNHPEAKWLLAEVQHRVEMLDDPDEHQETPPP